MLNKNENKITVNEKFVNYLKNKSESHSFQYYHSNQKSVQKDRYFTKNNQPVVLISANYKYFEPLAQSIQNIKSKFPSLLIYVYELGGFHSGMIKQLNQLCKHQCKLIKFDKDNFYRNVSPHVANLITYSWKPLVIQVSSDFGM